MKTVWVVTSEYNQYDQYGEYFLGVFKDKPTKKQLSKLIKYKEDSREVEHLLNGGGRIGYDDVWWWLREEKLE